MVKPRINKFKKKPHYKKSNQTQEKNLLNIYEDEFEDSKGKNLRQHNLDVLTGGVDQYQVDHINSEDDEEIDSDDAFGEAEEDQYNAMVLGVKDRHREKKLKNKSKKSHDTEDDSDDDKFDKEIILDEGEDFVDLSTLLDDASPKDNSDSDSDSDDEDEYSSNKHKKVNYKDLIGDADMDHDADDDLQFMGSDDEESDDDEAPIYQDDDDDDDEPSNLAKFITNLDSDQQKKKRFLNDQSLNVKESEFNLGSTPYNEDTSGKLDLKSLLKPLENESGFDHLQTKVQDLITTSKTQMATLKAPKVKRLQEKIIRTAAYEESKEQISQWEPVVKENREKDHLSFTQTESSDVQPKTTGVLSSHHRAENDMEKEIFEALQSHNIQEKTLKNFEDLQNQNLSLKEVKERQLKMMQMRNLLFKEELKAKRVAKIKSKAYRKVLRKEKAKLAKLEMDAEPQQDFEDSDEEATNSEVARARERMSLKHQNTSKWTKNLLKHGGREIESHQAITEQLQEHDRLTQKILGKSGEGEESEEDFDDMDNGTVDPSDKKQVINFAFNQLDKIVNDDTESEQSTKGIMGMKFMQRALERQKKEAEEMAEQVQEELRLMDQDSDAEVKGLESDSDDDTKHRQVVQGNEGRLQFTGTGASSEVQDEIPILAKKADRKKKKTNSATNAKPNVSKNGVYSLSTDNTNASTEQGVDVSREGEAANPWLSHQEDLPLAGIKSKKNQSGTLSQTEKATLKMNKVKSHIKEKDQSDLSKVKVDAQKTLTNIIYPDDENVKDQEDQTTMVHSNQLTSFNQRELVELAFANDDVVQEFEEDKLQTIEAQAPKDEEITLPGWGSWGGEKRQPKKRLFKAAKAGSGVDQAKRKDRKLNHVIINESHNPKLEKYTVRDVPSQYRSVEEFEQSMRGAIGKEWNPTTTFHKAIKPRVLVSKVGKVIDPIKAPFKQ